MIYQKMIQLHNIYDFICSDCNKRMLPVFNHYYLHTTPFKLVCLKCDKVIILKEKN